VLLAPELASGITRVKGVASKGVRLGNWLTLKHRLFASSESAKRKRRGSVLMTDAFQGPEFLSTPPCQLKNGTFFAADSPVTFTLGGTAGTQVLCGGDLTD